MKTTYVGVKQVDMGVSFFESSLYSLGLKGKPKEHRHFETSPILDQAHLSLFYF